MRQLAFVILMAALAGCTDSQPLSPVLAGWWRPEQASLGCERAALRFERQMVLVRRDGRHITAFDIVDAKLDQSEARLTLRIANEAAILAAIDQGKASMATELPKREIFLTLRRSGDRLLPGNALIQEDGPRGLRAPSRGEASAIMKIFTMTSCPA